MNKHGNQIDPPAVVISSMIVTPVLAAPSVDDFERRKKQQNRIEVRFVTVTAYNIDGKRLIHWKVN